MVIPPSIPRWVAPLLAGLSLASSLAACVTVVAGGPWLEGGNRVAVAAMSGAGAAGLRRGSCVGSLEGAAPEGGATAFLSRPVRSTAADRAASSNCQTGLSVDALTLDSD